MENHSNPKSLHQKYLDGNITGEELENLFRYFGTANEKDLEELIRSELAKTDHEPITPSEQQELELIHVQLTARLFGQEHDEKSKTIKLWPRIAAAASILIALSIGGYFVIHKQPALQTAYYKNDIAPGHNQATLTLANGKKIILTKGLSGTLAQQGNTMIGVTSQSAIAYTASAVNSNEPVEYNTLSTAIGEQSPYPLILADGTKVWLDAESSITFPVAFTGRDRSVKITGEAYFEVVHNSSTPFKVTVKNQTIEDIGTHFNINAYDDEKVVTTTLLEGSVKVSTNGQALLLKPGQKSVLQNNSLHLNEADIEETVAWKNGYFRFNDENIESIMRKLSRWYNIEAQYDGKTTDEGFYCRISRYKKISEVLKMLEKTKGVHFKIDGRRVTVMP